MKNCSFIKKVLRSILNNAKRNESYFIQKCLCGVILPNYNDFVKCCDLKKSSYNNFDEYLAVIFGIDYNKMITIINKLQTYKNITGMDIYNQCMATNI